MVVYLCGIYLWSDESPIANIINEDLFDLLFDDVSYFETLGTVMISGDLNSRVGSHNDFI